MRGALGRSGVSVNLSFFALPEDFFPLLEACLAHPGTRLLEAYSVFNMPVREFGTGAQAVAGLDLGRDPHGTGCAALLGLWAPDVMPHPNIRRIELSPTEFPPGTWRETTEGCGLFWFHTGGVHGDTIVASTLSAFTERGARAKCGVTPGPDAVDWKAHELFAKELTRGARRLSPARAGRILVLPAALKAHRAGAALIPRRNGHPVQAAGR